MQQRTQTQSLLFGLGGAVLGAVAGHFLTWGFLQVGLWAGMVPGAGVGIGFAWAARRPSMGFGILCGVLGLVAGLVSDFLFFPMLADPSPGYYFANVLHLGTQTKVMLLLGALAAAWFGRGRPGLDSGRRE